MRLSFQKPLERFECEVIKCSECLVISVRNLSGHRLTHNYKSKFCDRVSRIIVSAEHWSV